MCELVEAKSEYVMDARTYDVLLLVKIAKAMRLYIEERGFVLNLLPFKHRLWRKRDAKKILRCYFFERFSFRFFRFSALSFLVIGFFFELFPIPNSIAPIE